MGQVLDRRGFLKAVAAGMAAMSMPRVMSAAESSEPPNVIFILADDLGYGDVRCNNPEGKVPTPNIDRLAGQGVRCTDAHSPSAVCTPTRYGILTGRYCWRTRLKKGVLQGYDAPLIDADRPTVALFLKASGYETVAIGKWHLGLNWARKDSAKPAAAGNVDYSKPLKGGPRDIGFDYFFGIAASLDMPPYIYIENDRTVGLPTAKGTAKEYLRAGEREPDFRAVDVLPTLTKKAVERIDRHAKDNAARPMFMYLALTAPHTPVAPADFVKGKSQAGPYGDFVAEVDWTVGQIMEALERNKMAENTLLIVTSDNGSTNKVMTEFGHKPNGDLRGRKSDIWDGGHRIPFIARWPGQIKAGTSSDQLICLADLFATAAGIVGADLPARAAEDSFNILPALRGGELPADRPAVVHHSIDGMFAIRERRWKLVLGKGSGGWDGKGEADDPPGQLYDMQADQREQKNLYTSEPEVVKRLSDLLKTYQDTGRSRAWGRLQPPLEPKAVPPA